MRYLLINNGIVINAIIADAADIVHVSGYDLILAHDTAGPGWKYRDGVFIPPEPEPNPIILPAKPMTHLAFLLRFTAVERIAVRASSDPVVQDFLHLLNCAQEVRVDDPQTVAGVTFLESLGLLAAGRAAEILAA